MSDMISKEAAEVFLPEALFGAGCSVDQVDAAMKCVNSLIVVQNHTPAAPAVKMKPLVWETPPMGYDFAQTPWGRYFVGRWRGEWIWGWDGSDTKAESEEAAKAAAQADYEARILSALEGGEV